MDSAGWMELVARLLEWVGVGVIIAGAALATGWFLLDLRNGRRAGAYDRYRANLGRGILLGLEFLVGADIVATVTAPLSWESVGLLGMIVLIRTLLSFSLEIEIEGVVPWRRRSVMVAEDRYKHSHRQQLWLFWYIFSELNGVEEFGARMGEWRDFVW